MVRYQLEMTLVVFCIGAMAAVMAIGNAMFLKNELYNYILGGAAGTIEVRN
jgi:hypothetical protein